MTLRRFAGATGALLLTFGIGAITPTTGHAQSSVALPGENSIIVMTGCFWWTKHQGYVLSRPTMNQATVPQATCTVSEGDPMIKLRGDLSEHGLTGTKLGRYVMVSGRMGDEYPNHPDRLRKLTVRAVAPPAVAQVSRSERSFHPQHQ